MFVTFDETVKPTLVVARTAKNTHSYRRPSELVRWYELTFQTLVT